MAISWLRQRPGFDPRPVYVRFVVEKVTLGKVFLRFIHVSIIPQLVHIHLFNSTLIRKTIWQRIDNFKSITVFGISGSITQICTVTFPCI